MKTIIKPGMIFLDYNFRWSSPDAGQMIYLIQCSNETTENGRDLWETICFQETFGGYVSHKFVAGELLQMRCIGCISDLEKIRLSNRRFGRTVGFWWGAFIAIVFSGILNYFFGG